MLHHVSLGTNDIERSRAFYDPLMRLLGMRLILADERCLNYGAADVVFSLEKPIDGQPAGSGNGVHVAFQARDRHTVKRFHELAIANGGADGGPPGPRPEYDENYYAAFVRDPDGNKVEAVTFAAR
jgi:catechol 2,3-dioxygenase-like lactoylglutathione lyase family enzyme